MKNKKRVTSSRNWGLIFISSILILLGLALLGIAIIYVANFGWGSLLIGFIGLSTTGAAIMSIIKNDPSWILLDLIIPS